MIEITDLSDNPILKQLLIHYVYRQYEEDSIIDDEHLLMEFNLLQSEGRLVDLFIEEKLLNMR
ncbi:hypothetical protein N8987_04905 [Crocinitomix sp.]|nr:hypothetical protein [Crocinitomix sp.]